MRGSPGDAHAAQVVAGFERPWREVLGFVVEKWAHVQAIADALWRKRVLSGDEVTEIIGRGGSSAADTAE